VRGSRVLADAGVVFPVAPAQRPLRDAHDRVRSFREPGLARETLRIWILERG
jgi:hypothetical protein